MPCTMIVICTYEICTQVIYVATGNANTYTYIHTYKKG